MSKVRGAITVDILLLKYQKQAVTAVLNSQYNQSNTKNNTHMVLPNALRKSWMYQMLLFIVSRDISQSEIKFVIGNFTGVSIMNFISDWESEIVHQSVRQTNSSEN